MVLLRATRVFESAGAMREINQLRLRYFREVLACGTITG
jgi:hypothetical protein